MVDKKDSFNKGLQISEEALAALTKELGSLVKSDREAAGITVAQLAQSTRIMITFLQDLEEGHFEKLPDAVFVKGFLKSIYKVLGKNPNEALELLGRLTSGAKVKGVALEPAQVEQVSKSLLSEKTLLKNVKKFTQSINRSYLVTVVLVFVGVTVGLVAINQMRTPEKRPNKKLAEADELKKPSSYEPSQMERAPEPAINQEQSNVVDETLESLPDEGEIESEVTPEQQYATAEDQEQVIEVWVKEEVRVRMSIDQKAWETSRLKPDHYVFKFSNHADLLIFDAAALDISFNGRSLGALGKPGRVRSLSFVAGSPEVTTKM